MKTLAQQLSTYQRYHTKLITKLTHFIGIPLAIIPVLMIFSWINFGVNGWFHIGISWLALLGLFIYYLLLDKELAIATIVGLVILNIIARIIAQGTPNWIGLKWLIIIFVVAWAIQFIGHLFEGKRPALFDNFFQVLIAPLFISAEIAFMLGKKSKLKAEMAALTKPEISKDSL